MSEPVTATNPNDLLQRLAAALGQLPQASPPQAMPFAFQQQQPMMPPMNGGPAPMPMTGALQPTAVSIPIELQLPDGRVMTANLQFPPEHLNNPGFLHMLLQQFGPILKAYAPRQNGYGGGGGYGQPQNGYGNNYGGGYGGNNFRRGGFYGGRRY